MFTDRDIRNLKPEAKIKDTRGGRGFGIRVKPDGTKIFFYGYDSPVTGARRFLTLGEYPGLSLKDATIKHGEAYKLVKAGGDPLEVKHQASEDHRKAPTVKTLCGEYIERHAKKFKRSWETDERILNHDVIPAWGNRKAAEITKRDVVLLLEKIVDRGAPGMANNVFALVRKMFNFAIEKDILQQTPCYGVKRPAPTNQKDRSLTEPEIKTFWSNLDACAMSAEIRDALKLILITAQRPGEVIGMNASEIDGQWWTIPAERAKNKRAHRVFLSAMAQEIIMEAIERVKAARGVPEDEEYNGYLFPTPSLKKSQPIAGQALIVAVSFNLKCPLSGLKLKRTHTFDSEGKLITVNRLGVDHFTPHDMRRTANTLMASCKVIKEYRERVLNHTLEKLDGTYNMYDYDDEKRGALETLSRKLTSILTGEAVGKVIPMNRAKTS
jgi:integrase